MAEQTRNTREAAADATKVSVAGRFTWAGLDWIFSATDSLVIWIGFPLCAILGFCILSKCLRKDLAEAVVVGGASADHGSRMGMYRATGRTSGGMAVYEHEKGLHCLWFVKATGTRLLGAKNDEGDSEGNAFLLLRDEVVSPDKSDGCWQENVNGGAWRQNLNVKVIRVMKKEFKLRGATAGHGSLFGNYRATGRMSGARVVYEHQSGQHCLWFVDATGKWLLGAKSDEGQNRASLSLSESVNSPDQSSISWKEYVNGAWNDNKAIRLSETSGMVKWSLMAIGAWHIATVMARWQLLVIAGLWQTTIFLANLLWLGTRKGVTLAICHLGFLWLESVYQGLAMACFFIFILWCFCMGDFALHVHWGGGQFITSKSKQHVWL